MKIVCDACAAVYSIADDKVRGKVFKIRCKKCSHVIMVRGTAAPTSEVRAHGEWHAVVDGQQLGPFDRAEVLRRREAGALDDETYVWREGMADWAALGTVDELRAQPSAPPSVEVGEMTRLRNERNETSVLFTLGNLAQLASKPQPKPAAATASATGAPPEEGSGLIDIRALASTWAQPAGQAKPATATEDPLSIYAPIGLADPIVLVPTTSHGTDRRLLVALVAMLALVAALAVVLVVVLTRENGTAQAPATVPVTMPVPVKVEAPPPPAPVEVAAVEPKPDPTAPKAESKPEPTKREPEPPPKRTRVAAPRVTPKALEPAPAKEACTDVSCAYSNYAEKCCEPFKPKTAPKPSTTAPSDLPENLDRAALAKGIATIKAQKCGASSAAKGDVTVSVKVTAEGTVSSVTVKSSPDPALSACVVREAKQGAFAKTKRGGSFSYFWRF